MSEDRQIVFLGIGLIAAGIYFIYKSKDNSAMQKWFDEVRDASSSFRRNSFHSKEFMQTHTYLGGLLAVFMGLFALVSRISLFQTKTGEYFGLLFIGIIFVGFSVLYFCLFWRLRKR